MHINKINLIDVVVKHFWITLWGGPVRNVSQKTKHPSLSSSDDALCHLNI